MENIFVEFLPPWVETGLQPAFYDKESGTVLQQTARMYARVNMLIRMFNRLSKNTKDEVERFEGVVNDEIERFEGVVNDTVEDYIKKFNDLHDYVEDYFDNLDVQAEIDHKLDEMVEQGTLQEIIASYLDSDVAWTYDSVAEMQTATNLQPESYAQTYGYYAVGDGGGAKYNVREPGESETPNNITTFAVGDYIAELVIEPVMYVKQFGCKGDGTTDDTTRFNTAIASAKKLYVNSGNYLISRLLPEEHQEIEGIGEAKVSLNGTTYPLCQFVTDFKMKNIFVESTNNNLEWNRCNISNINNVYLEDCSFKGFKHTAEHPNAWGILIGNSSNIYIKNCYFDDNSLSDIALVNGCNNITIDQCSGSHFHIDIEPDSTTANNNIKITNCTIETLDAQENQFTGTATKSLLVYNCTIGTFKYDGSDTILENCKVTTIDNIPSSNVIYGGKLELINSLNLSDNILTDPYIDTYEYNNSGAENWLSHYFTVGNTDAVTTVKDNDGIQFVLNNSNASATTVIKHQPINCNAGDKFILRVNSKCNYPADANYVSLNFFIRWYNGDDQISQQVISMNRGTVNNTTPFSEQSAVLVAPNTTTKVQIFVSNACNVSGPITASQSLYLRSVELFKVNSADVSKEQPKLPVRTKRVFERTNAIGSANFGKYNTGDVMYYKSPSTYIGAVATSDGYGSSATWKNFGALAS